MVKSMYLDVINASTIPRSKHVWKVKVPLKIKVFMWFVHTIWQNATGHDL